MQQHSGVLYFVNRSLTFAKETCGTL